MHLLCIITRLYREKTPVLCEYLNQPRNSSLVSLETPTEFLDSIDVPQTSYEIYNWFKLENIRRANNNTNNDTNKLRYRCLAQSYDFTSFVYFVLFFSCQIHLPEMYCTRETKNNLYYKMARIEPYERIWVTIGIINHVALTERKCIFYLTGKRSYWSKSVAFFSLDQTRQYF